MCSKVVNFQNLTVDVIIELGFPLIEKEILHFDKE